MMDAVSQEERVLEWTFFTKTMGGGGPVKRKEVDNDGIMGPEGRVKVAVAVAVGSQSTVVGGRRKLEKKDGPRGEWKKGRNMKSNAYGPRSTPCANEATSISELVGPLYIAQVSTYGTLSACIPLCHCPTACSLSLLLPSELHLGTEPTPPMSFIASCSHQWITCSLTRPPVDHHLLPDPVPHSQPLLYHL